MSVYQMWVRTIEPKHRVRLNEPIVSAVPWLTSGKPRDCWGSIGSSGQLVISLDPPGADGKRILDEAFETGRVRINEASAESLSLSRFIASMWPVRFLAEAGRQRMSLVLPRETRELGIVPNDQEPVVLCMIDDALEVWNTRDWVEHVRGTRRDLDSIQERVSEQLG